MRTATPLFLVALLLTSAINLAYADRLQSLINDLRSADTETKLNAIKKLGESGDIRAVPPLVETLHDGRDVVRQYAIEALLNLSRVLDHVYVGLKRWLQTLINKLRLHPSDEVITVEQPVAPLRRVIGKTALREGESRHAAVSWSKPRG
jgi:HEAT repeat protein